VIPRPVGYALAAVLTAAFVGNLFYGGPVMGTVILTLFGLLVAGQATPDTPVWCPACARMRCQCGTTPTEPRADADWAQYLNDDDRAWLAGHGWTAPGDPLAPGVSQITDENGWRTVEYTDGTTEQYAVTDHDRTRRLADTIAARQRADAAASVRPTAFDCGSCGVPLKFETRKSPPRASYVHAWTLRFECETGGTDAHTADLAPRNAPPPDPGPVPDGDYETIVDGMGRPVRYIPTDR
jgi:hypothetical protein